MPEQQNIEWKQSWRDEYLKWICGFANAQGGKILIGFDDNGELVGVSDAKRLMDDIPNKIQTTLGIICDINLIEKDKKNYIEIHTIPYEIPISHKGKYYYRSGSTNQELRGVSLQQFILRKMGKTWDDVAETRASIDDIDMDAVEYFKENAIKSGRLPISKSDTTEIIFNNLNLYTDDGKLKRAAILLFGKKPDKFYPTVSLKIGRFVNSDSDLRFQDVIEGNCIEMVDKAIEIFFKKYVPYSIKYVGIRREEIPEYPFDAVREALLNAVAHRDYSIHAPIQMRVYNDRIDIWNNGALLSGLSFDDLKKTHSSILRNPIISNVFFRAGFVEAWGKGTTNIVDECKKSGLPEPEFYSHSGGFVITIFKDIYNEKHLKSLDLNDRQIKAIIFAKEEGSITNSDYQQLNNVSRNTASRDLNELSEQKNILIKKGKHGLAVQYELKT